MQKWEEFKCSLLSRIEIISLFTGSEIQLPADKCYGKICLSAAKKSRVGQVGHGNSTLMKPSLPWINLVVLNKTGEQNRVFDFVLFHYLSTGSIAFRCCF